MRYRVISTLCTLCLVLQLTPDHVMTTVDGDTFRLYTVGIPPHQDVRVVPVNTPEEGKPGYIEAKLFTVEWLNRGPFIVSTCGKDSFGRYLASVTRGDEDLGKLLITNGLGVPYAKRKKP